MKWLRFVGAATSGCILALPICAATYDGSRPFLCAPTSILSCEAGNCEKETTDSVNLPRFLDFDIAKKTVSGTRVDGKPLATTIQSISHIEDNLALQGVEGHVVWSVVVAESSGDMTLAAAGDGTGYVVFGACTLR
jgi:hypothetical protein